MSREPQPTPGPRPRDTRRAPGAPAARSWTRLLRVLVLLDSWSPDSAHLTSPQAARRHLRSEWTRSGDLTVRQAATLLALDETTGWTA